MRQYTRSSSAIRVYLFLRKIRSPIPFLTRNVLKPATLVVRGARDLRIIFNDVVLNPVVEPEQVADLTRGDAVASHRDVEQVQPEVLIDPVALLLAR